jgi:hypothetical protein
MSTMKIRSLGYLVTVTLLSVTAIGQTAAPPATIGPTSSLQQQLQQLDATSRRVQADLERVRVDKWKADGSVKDQGRDNINSIEKNLGYALPSLMQQVQSNPTSVAAAVKLYRNINVVYDVLVSVAESTGAFGSKDDYQSLATDVANFDNIRRNIGDEVEQLATAQDVAYTNLLHEERARQAAVEAAPPKKVIIDDTEPAKKTSKSAKTKKKTTTESSTSSSTSQPK